MRQELKYDGIAIFSDYDGTLTDKRDRLHRENVRAIEYFIANGGQFSLATGRPFRVYRELNIPVTMPVILSNGAEIYDDAAKKSLYQSTMGDSVLSLIERICQQCPRLKVSANAYGGHFCFQTGDIGDSEAFMQKMIPVSGLPALRGTIMALGIAGNSEDLSLVCRLIEQEYPEFTWMIVYESIINILPQGMSKGSALAFLKETYFQHREKPYIVAVGDSDNDASLLRESDFAFAVGNGMPSALHAADMILKDNSCPCIPQIIDYINANPLPPGKQTKG